MPGCGVCNDAGDCACCSYHRTPALPHTKCGELWSRHIGGPLIDGGGSGRNAGYGWPYAMCPPPIVVAGETKVVAGGHVIIDRDGPFERIDTDQPARGDNNWAQTRSGAPLSGLDAVLDALPPTLTFAQIRTFMITGKPAPYEHLRAGNPMQLVVEVAAATRA